MCQRIGNTIVCGRHGAGTKKRPANVPPCAYCGAPSSRLCDEPTGQHTTCDVALCDRCTAARPGNRDFCREHKAAHPLSL